MKAVVFHKVDDIQINDVPEPRLNGPQDAIVRLTANAICGTDLHFIRGTLSGMKPGIILGHEGVGIVEEVGDEVTNIRVGDRVIVCSTIACGKCERCQVEDYSQCVKANPNGPYSGTAFFGGPETSGSFNGLQSKRARIPYADTVLVKLPDEVNDEQAILLSDIFLTGYFGALLADVGPGKSVVVFGCGPVGQFAVMSAKILGANRIFAVDIIQSRLEAARALGAETIDYQQVSPVQYLKEATGGAGVDCAIDAVGVDANRPHSGPAEEDSEKLKKEFKKELKQIGTKSYPQGDNWHPGDAPSQVLRWAVESLRGAGTLGIVGVYPPQIDSFPLGEAMNKNLSIKMGNCPHRRYVPKLIEMVRSGQADPSKVITQVGALSSALEAYQAFDKREDGWIKVALDPQDRSREAA